jgi:sugar phosphate isomerase/epimerase
MTQATRREFLGAGLAAAASTAFGAPLGMPIGFQTFTIREMLAKDFEGTLKMMAGLGYQSAEMCSPPGYVSSGFGPLEKYSAAEMKAIFKKSGLKCESCHYGFAEMKTKIDERIAFAKGLGLKYMVCSSFGIKPDAPMDAWRKAATDLNEIGAKVKKAGMQAAFHNHNFEFQKIDGVLIYDELMKAFDPKLVKMQFQVAVVSIGFQAADYLEKYPGRFCSLHLADWAAAEKKQAAVGQGSVDWKKLFSVAKKGGVKNYFVEMNLDLMKASAPYLRDLKV